MSRTSTRVRVDGVASMASSSLHAIDATRSSPRPSREVQTRTRCSEGYTATARDQRETPKLKHERPLLITPKWSAYRRREEKKEN